MALGHGDERVTGVHEAALDLEARLHEAQIVGYRKRGHLETDAGRRPPGEVLVWRRGGRKEEHTLETEPPAGLRGDDEMADVRRVEAAADDAEERACLVHGTRGAPARRPTART